MALHKSGCSSLLLLVWGTFWRISKLLLVLLCLTTTVCMANDGTAETLIGLVGRDYIMMGADTSVSRSIVVTSSTMDKIVALHESSSSGQEVIAVAATGDLAHVKDLLHILQSHSAASLYESFGWNVGGSSSTAGSISSGDDVCVISLSNDNDNNDNINPQFVSSGISVSEVAKLARNCISSRLRSNQRLSVRLLVAGMQYEHEPKEQHDTHTETNKKPTSSYISGDVQKQLERVFRQRDNDADDENNHEKHDDSVNKQDASSLEGPNEPRQQLLSLQSQSQALPSKLLRPRLYWLDEYGSLQTIRYGSHGLGSNFLLAILDGQYCDDLSRDEAAALIQSCFQQLSQRYSKNSPTPPLLKCIDATGCRIYSTTSGSGSTKNDDQQRPS